MLITISTIPTSTSVEKSKIRLTAKLRLYSHKLTTQEKNIDKYLKENHNTSLIDFCLKLINNFYLNYNKDENVVYITFDKQDDKIASLITYGNLLVKGSNILKKIFKPIILL